MGFYLNRLFGYFYFSFKKQYTKSRNVQLYFIHIPKLARADAKVVTPRAKEDDEP